MSAKELSIITNTATMKTLAFLFLSLLPFTQAFSATLDKPTTAPAAPTKTSNSKKIPPAIYDYDEQNWESKFAIPPKDLIRRAKTIIYDKGLGTLDGGACLAPNFTFRAAVVETNRDDFLKALASFQLDESFEITQSYFGFTVDPLQTNRVWFMNRQTAKFVNDFFGVTADRRELVLPPQTFHMDFDESGKVIEFGFYTADRNQGNTGGLGGAFAYFYGVGKPLPFPEGKPYKPSLQRRIFEKLAPLLQRS